MFDTEIRSERLITRPPRNSDYSAWSSLRTGSRGQLEPFEPKWPVDALSRSDWNRRMRYWRDMQRSKSGLIFLCFLASDPSCLVGGVSLNNIRFGSARSASVGYWLGEAYSGQGYMTEAVVAVAKWSFVSLGLERLEAGTVPENEKSASVLIRAGFTEEGFAREYLEIAGRRRDHRLFGLVRRDLGV